MFQLSSGSWFDAIDGWRRLIRGKIGHGESGSIDLHRRRRHGRMAHGRHHCGTPRSDSGRGLQITLVESETIGIVGVGEGTWPTMRTTLKKMGISETDFFRECNASFKQGAKFARWVTGEESDFYYHPLVLPEGFPSLDLAPFWTKYSDEHEDAPSFSDAVCFQEAVCELGLAPKLITSPEYAGVANYAYHLDAGRFASFIRDHCVKNLGIRHIVDEVTGVVKNDTGDIDYVETSKSGRLGGDLFIDASGFRSLLLGETLGVPFVDCSDVLFIDRALAMQVPYDDETKQHRSAYGIHRAKAWLDLGHRAAKPARRRLCLFELLIPPPMPPLRNCALMSATGIDDLQPREIKIRFRAPPDILEGKLRRGGPRRGIPGAARGVRPGADRAICRHDQRHDAGNA